MNSKQLLLVAFHFPPIRGSSGFQRTLAFTRYLPDFGWQATVLTARKGVYTDTAEDNDRLIPPEVTVIRAAAIDAARNLSIKGRYFDFLALPDRWQSWIPSAILCGLIRILRSRPQALFSTFPIASAHVVGLVLHRLTGLPWIADLRDPMDQTTYPENPRVRRAYRWIEEQVFRYARRVVVTTPGTAALYRQRYGPLASSKLLVIPNGFDPEVFPVGYDSTAPQQGGRSEITEESPLLLLHSGQLYPSERDPQPFFAALSRVRQKDPGLLVNVKIRLRATGHDSIYEPLLTKHGLNDLVTLAPPISYEQAIRETLAADALLIFQASNCDSQIPAKAYECLYAGRPILALTSRLGDTGRLLTSMGIDSIAALEDSDAIYSMLLGELPKLRAGKASVPDRGHVAQLSRKFRTAELADALAGL
ncbi:MAG: glycosyltransferase [Gammaproteobacteria bacterium PRO9]|nr:glycosyltransferase [Gammaproteobacteria bacterium PRO9]